MKPKQGLILMKIIADKTEKLKAIHEALKKEDYFDIHSDDARQDLLVAMLIDLEKTLYFQRGAREFR